MKNNNKQTPQDQKHLETPLSDAEHEALHAQGIPHTHSHMHEQGSIHSPEAEYSHSHDLSHTHETEHGRSHTHEIEHTHSHTHVVEHTHSHVHEDGQLQTHSHGEGHTHVHSHEHTKNVLNRLSRAIGHLQHVRGMVEEGRDCSEVLIQLAAVQSALNNTAKVILQDHMKHCIVDAAVHGDMDVIEELCEAIDRFL